MNRNREFVELYTELLGEKFDGKAIWQRIADKELVAVPHFVGSEYEGSNAKLMVVGRAVNGWQIETDSCVDLERTVGFILDQKKPFADIVKREGIPDIEHPEKRPYRYITSQFWKLTKLILEQYGDSEGGNWYDDPKRWNERVVWSNLYKVAPRNGRNPDFKFIKPQIEAYIDIVEKEIQLYQPRRILFMTNSDYFIPWKRKKSFADIMENYVPRDGFVVATASYGDSKVVVCKRPDYKWGISENELMRMAAEIRTAFGD